MSDIILVPPGLRGQQQESGCIIFQGKFDKDGYGRFWYKGKTRRAHRLALEAKLERPIREGYYACHTCDNPSCVNPEHLWEGKAKDNTNDSVAKGRFGRKRRKLSDEEVREIWEKLNQGRTHRSLAEEYGVSKPIITDIFRGRGYQEISKEYTANLEFAGSGKRLRKLTDEQVEEIRERLAQGQSQRSIAKVYGVSNHAINRIAHGFTYKE